MLKEKNYMLMNENIAIKLTGLLQLAQVTDLQSGHISLFCLGCAMKPEEH